MKGIAKSHGESLDDAAILQLAADRADPLLRVVGRARALQPLIAVLAVLPVLVVLQRGGLSDSGARWGLRALDVLASQTPAEFLVPGQSPQTRALAKQPPAATWLTAGVLRVVGTRRVNSVLLVSLLSAAGCVWWTFRLFHRVIGPRAGFWAAVLLATHGGLLSAAGSASPTAPALLLVLMTLHAWQRHSRARDAVVTIPLLLAGVALGLCVLTGGLIAVACLAVLLLHPAVAWFLDPWLAPQNRRRPTLGRPYVAVAVVLMTGFCTCGWWIGMQDGWNWNNWRGDPIVVNAASSIAFAEKYPWLRHAVRWLVVFGPLAPLCLFGLWKGVPQTDVPRRDTAPASPAPRVFLVCWLLVGVAFQVVAGSQLPVAAVERTASELFLIVPVLGLAAVAIDAFLQRAFPVSITVIAAALVVGLTPLTLWLPDASFDLAHSAEWLLGGAIVVTVLIVWSFRWFGHEIRCRILVIAGVACLLAAGLTAGILSLPRLAGDERQLDALRAKLPASSAGIVFLVSNAPPPPRLVYALRSIQPEGSLTTIDTLKTSPRELLIKFPLRSGVLVVEWMTVGESAAIADLPGRKLVSTGPSVFYRGRDLRASVMSPERGKMKDEG